MENNELIFSSDCAINFDDLGEFRDYTDDIQKMLQNLIDIKNNHSAVFKQELFREILKADPQDTFHAPAFKDLVNVILQILTQRKEYFNSRPQIYKLIFHNLTQILEESFVSYQFSQDTGANICKFIIDEGKRKAFSQSQKMTLLLCISKLAKRLSYIDDLQNFSQLLYYCIDEQSIVIQKNATEEWKKMMLQVYSEVVELSTRNRKVRELLGTKIDEQSMLGMDHLFLGYKIQLWRKDWQKANTYLKRMESEKLNSYNVFRLVVKKNGN